MTSRVKCNRCGDCCEVIWIMYPKCKFSREPNGEFCREHWHRISRLAARERIGGTNFDSWDWRGFYFYLCDQFDTTSRLCLAHKTRPQVCRGFPWYTRKPKPETMWAFPRCVFHLGGSNAS